MKRGKILGGKWAKLMDEADESTQGNNMGTNRCSVIETPAYYIAPLFDPSTRYTVHVIFKLLQTSLNRISLICHSEKTAFSLISSVFELILSVFSVDFVQFYIESIRYSTKVERGLEFSASSHGRALLPDDDPLSRQNFIN